MSKQICPACKESFAGTAAGDRHRSGDWEPNTKTPRRCLSVDEMTEKGMIRNAFGHWSTGEGYEGPSTP